jgi:hypothetical protein
VRQFGNLISKNFKKSNSKLKNTGNISECSQWFILPDFEYEMHYILSSIKITKYADPGAWIVQLCSFWKWKCFEALHPPQVRQFGILVSKNFKKSDLNLKNTRNISECSQWFILPDFEYEMLSSIEITKYADPGAWIV